MTEVLQYTCANLGVLMCACVPALEEEAGGSLGLVDQTARPNGQDQVPVRDLVSKEQGGRLLRNEV